MNGVVSVAIGVWLVMVLYHGNHMRLIDQLSRQGGFVKWGASVIILVYIRDHVSGQAGPVINGLIILAFLAMFIQEGGTNMQTLEAEFNKLFNIKQPVQHWSK